MKPDVETAKEYLKKENFSEYSKAYIMTNELLRLSLKYIPKNADILTVAGSGDHPLFCLLTDPNSVDTFDISYNAKVVMDIKTAAILKMPFNSYRILLNNLYEDNNITDIYDMSEIMKILSPDEQEYIKKISGTSIINRSGLSLFSSPYLFMEKPEYNQIQSKVDGLFNFMWTNIDSLHTKLNKTYDFVHLSNIFDYMKRDQATDALLSLIPYVNRGGKIYFELRRQFTPNKKWFHDFCNNVSDKYNQKWKYMLKREDRTKCILQRTK